MSSLSYEDESILYLLWGCEKVQVIWFKHFPDVDNNFFDMDVLDWFLQNLKSKIDINEGAIWKTIFLWEFISFGFLIINMCYSENDFGGDSL